MDLFFLYACFFSGNLLFANTAIILLAMSTIYGKYYPDGQPVSSHDLAVMEQPLNHWCPDNTGTWLDQSIGLGHLQLYNTPESLPERLPYYSKLNELAITADARIDNREEIYAVLGRHTAADKAIPDSGLILLLYERFGRACVRHLVGDFAFAIWDGRAQLLFCARDQMGVKPFFYYEDNHCFAFASEKKGILAIPGIDKTINAAFLYNQMMWPPEQSTDTTLYAKIKRLPPAHTLVISKHSPAVQLQQYWTLDAHREIRLGSKEAYYEGLLHHFEQAVQCRVRTMYPVGAELSGGLDSSAITGAAQQYLQPKGIQLITFSNALSRSMAAQHKQLQVYDEKPYMDAVIAYNRIEDAIFITEKVWDDPLQEIDFLLQVDDGLEKWGPLWQVPVKHAARKRGVRTLLSGFPGDQMVTNTSRNHCMDLLDKHEYARYFFTRDQHTRGFNRLRPFIPHAVAYRLHLWKQQAGWHNAFIRAASGIYHIPPVYKIRQGDILWQNPVYKERFSSYRHWQKYSLLQPLVSQRMESETRHGLYFRMEPRFPMADIRLTQFYSAMPNHLKYEGPLSRMAYRTAVKKYLPPLVQQRDDKAGSVAPFLIPTLNHTHLLVEQLLHQLPETTLVNKQAVLQKITRIKKRNNPQRIPTLQNMIDDLLPAPELLRWLCNNRVNELFSGQ